MPRSRVPTHPARIIAGSFLLVILVGTGFLMLPASTQSGTSASFLQALFTSTSATCVTGLVVVDTASFWSPFGQIVIVALIQVGGLGIVVLTALTLVLFGRRAGLRQRILMQAGSSADDASGVIRLVRMIGFVTLLVEVVIAGLYAVWMIARYDYDLGTAAWHGIFHSISAFNNAGFGLWPDNLMLFVADPFVTILTALAIIAGGLGFPVWLGLWRRREDRRNRLSLHARLVLIGTAGLIAFGMITTLIFEWSNARTLGPLSVGAKLLAAFFQGVTPRTAGFNTIDYTAIRDDTELAQTMLMFVGGGPASTAGGIKVTTFIVLGLFVLAHARGRTDTTAFGRRVPVAAISQALTVAFIAVNLVVLSALVIIWETGLQLDQVLFETVSAFATVGLSTGITAQLPSLSQSILIALMFIGRTGPYTIALALAMRQHDVRYRLPEERPIIG